MRSLTLFLFCSPMMISLIAACGFPGSPAHGRIRTTDENFKEGAIVTFECDPGYQLLGRATTRCVKSEWATPGIPFCAREMTYAKPTGSTSNPETAPLAVDDKKKTCSRSSQGKAHSWWVDLIERMEVDVVEIHFGMELDNLEFQILIEDHDTLKNASCVKRSITTIDSEAVRYFKCEPGSVGSVVHISVSKASEFILELCEVNVYSQSLLSSHDACGSASVGRVESYMRKCFETMPPDNTFHGTQKLCQNLGGELWMGGDGDFILWMMRVHNLSTVWLGQKSSRRKAILCDYLTLSWDETTSTSSSTTVHNVACNEKHPAICVRNSHSCGRLPLPRHAAIWKTSDILLSGFESQDLVCEANFHRSGPKNTLCRIDGGVNQSHPSLCLKSPCGAPPSIPNGYPVLRPSPRLFCEDESFVLHGDPGISCNVETRKWTEPQCVCIKLTEGFTYTERSIKSRLLQGVELFPVFSRFGVLILVFSLLMLSCVWVVFLFNMIHFYQVIKPKLAQTRNRSMVLESMHEQLSYMDNPHQPGLENETSSANATFDNNEIELSSRDAVEITRGNSFSTPKTPATPRFRLNESSIRIPKIEFTRPFP